MVDPNCGIDMKYSLSDELWARIEPPPRHRRKREYRGGRGWMIGKR